MTNTKILERMREQFMQPEITRHMKWYEADTELGPY